MSLLVVDDKQVLSELWISLVSLIQSYVAGHDLGNPVGRVLIDDGADGRLTLRGDRKILALEWKCETGMGAWQLYEDDPGPERRLSDGSFRVGTDSNVEFSDRKGRLELEVAAEAFTAMIYDED